MTTDQDPFAERRAALVAELARDGVRDERVLRAMAAVPRERFVPHDLVDYAYENRPLPIGAGQTISQPLIVAVMAAAAAPGVQDRVLEIGAGSGYGAAVLAQLAAHVTTVERIAELADRARAALLTAGIDNVEVVTADGSGTNPGGPWSAIVVTAGAPEVPVGLASDLAPGGRLVVPVGPEGRQRLVRVSRADDGSLSEQDLGGVAFVPLIGEGGWPDEGLD